MRRREGIFARTSGVLRGKLYVDRAREISSLVTVLHRHGRSLVLPGSERGGIRRIVMIFERRQFAQKLLSERAQGFSQRNHGFDLPDDLHHGALNVRIVGA